MDVYLVDALNSTPRPWTNRPNRHSSLTSSMPLSYVEIGDPLTISCEYVQFRCPNARQLLKPTDVLLTANVRNCVSRDRCLESIITYDQNARFIRNVSGTTDHTYTYRAGPFDVSEYGHPILFYTPGYEGSDIFVTLKAHAIRNSPTRWVDTVVDGMKSIVGIASSTLVAAPLYGQILSSLGSATLGAGGALLKRALQHNTQMFDPVTLKLTSRFNHDMSADEPLVKGKYIVLVHNDNDDLILSSVNNGEKALCDDGTSIYDYFLDGNRLVHRKKNTFYTKSYFVLSVDTSERRELRDFDFTSMCMEMVKELPDFPPSDDRSSSSSTLTKSPSVRKSELEERLIDVARDSYHLLLVKAIREIDDQESRQPQRGSYGTIETVEPTENRLRQALLQQLKASDPEIAKTFFQ